MASQAHLSAVVQIAAHRYRIARLRPSKEGSAMHVEYAEPGEWYIESTAHAAARVLVHNQRMAGDHVELLHGIWVQCEDQLVRPWHLSASGASVAPVTSPHPAQRRTPASTPVARA